MPSLMFKPPIDDPSGSLPAGDAETTASFIGIAVAISGNVLISLALNCQKLAHQRLEKERQARLRDSRYKSTYSNQKSSSSSSAINHRRSSGEENNTAAGGTSENNHAENSTAVPHVERGSSRSSRSRETSTRLKSNSRDRGQVILLETTPLLRLGADGSPSFDDSVRKRDETRSKPRKRTFLDGVFRSKRRDGPRNDDERPGSLQYEDPVIETAVIPVDLSQVGSSEDNLGNNHVEEDHGPGVGNNYLRSKLWCVFPYYSKSTLRLSIHLRWLGFLLMNIGEIGNFISYAFAPASVVAPLGTVS